jgi:hypothetical protein
MVDPVLIISIITLIGNIVSPIILGCVYAFRKIKKSSCMNCFQSEQDTTDDIPKAPITTNSGN